MPQSLEPITVAELGNRFHGYVLVNIQGSAPGDRVDVEHLALAVVEGACRLYVRGATAVIEPCATVCQLDFVAQAADDVDRVRGNAIGIQYVVRKAQHIRGSKLDRGAFRGVGYRLFGEADHFDIADVCTNQV